MPLVLPSVVDAPVHSLQPSTGPWPDRTLRPALSTPDFAPPNRSPFGTVGTAVVLRKDKHAALARRPCWLSTTSLSCPRRYGRGRNQVGGENRPCLPLAQGCVLAHAFNKSNASGGGSPIKAEPALRAALASLNRNTAATPAPDFSPNIPAKIWLFANPGY
jgi:hypothetical protein